MTENCFPFSLLVLHTSPLLSLSPSLPPLVSHLLGVILWDVQARWPEGVQPRSTDHQRRHPHF